VRQVIQLDHPLGAILLTGLRDRTTEKREFRSLCDRLSRILAVEATRTIATRKVTVESPLEQAEGCVMNAPVVVVPILRAGLGMLSSFLDIVPEASVGYIGMERDEQTAEAGEYYCKTPETKGAKVFVIDPMLATGGSAQGALKVLKTKGAEDCILVSIVAAPEGIDEIHSVYPEVPIVTAAVDRCLDDRKYIRPGLGDFGDRLFGT